MSKSDMTEGNIIKSIVIFAIPLLGASLVQQLYNTTDMIFVGNFINKQAAAAVGASGLLFTCLIGLMTGISVGVGIVIAKQIGAKDLKKAEQTLNTAIYFSLISGLILTVLGFLFSEKLLILINTPKEILKDSTIYLKIYFLSMLPMIFYNVGSSIIRSSGNSKTPFYILIVGGITNVIANTMFIVIIKLGVVGVAVATLISQTVTAILIFKYLINPNFFLKLKMKNLKINFRLLKQMLHYGLPTGFQSMAITFSNIVVQYNINNYGSDAVAAYATYFKIENFIWMPIVALGQAITTFSGQNSGAKNFSRIKKGTILLTLMTMVLSILIAVFIIAFSETFFKIFIKDKSVIDLGKEILFITFPFYWLYSILEIMGASIRGMGHSLSSMFVIISTLCIGRILILFNIHSLGFRGIAFVYPITWACAATIFSIIFFKIINKNKFVEIQ